MSGRQRPSPRATLIKSKTPSTISEHKTGTQPLARQAGGRCTATGTRGKGIAAWSQGAEVPELPLGLSAGLRLCREGEVSLLGARSRQAK